MDIILIKGIKETDKVNMKQLFSQSLYFTRFKPTRKMAEGRWLWYLFYLSISTGVLVIRTSEKLSEVIEERECVLNL